MRVVLSPKVYDYWVDVALIPWLQKLTRWSPFKGLNVIKKKAYWFKRRRDLERGGEASESNGNIKR